MLMSPTSWCGWSHHPEQRARGVGSSRLAKRAQVACALRVEPCRRDGQELVDPFQDDVGRGTGRRIARVVALPDMHGRRAPIEPGLRRREERGLVVDVNVPIGREAARDLGEVVLLVLVHEDVRAGRQEQTRPSDLHRLVDTVAVREDHRLPERPEPFDHRERARVEETLERNAENRPLNVARSRLARVGAAETHERPRVIDDACLLAHLLVDRPEACRALGADGGTEPILDPSLGGVVVDQGVVDVQEEDPAHRPRGYRARSCSRFAAPRSTTPRSSPTWGPRGVRTSRPTPRSSRTGGGATTPSGPTTAMWPSARGPASATRTRRIRPGPSCRSATRASAASSFRRTTPPNISMRATTSSRGERRTTARIRFRRTRVRTTASPTRSCGDAAIARSGEARAGSWTFSRTASASRR